MGNSNDRLWSVQDLSAFLDIPVHTIRGWRKTGYGPPARRVGKHLRWDPVQVRRWFDGLGQNDAA
ncbi:helix-turn-helix domain-containing protein [Crossiella sp. CA-258035]|uniref:helix-turn-helix transcriptional regulator n=1 Tax=Crossiella sp. CA-258035 TaxID=2981138 RepID=UPI0024BD0148|nr:helix-turn-helix domain-containing protein [Crossiella sp. CA-258035]WHT21189.1 helix-turn-helix domain-containing protein [Crossiella sp. CA-258035]